MHHPNTPDLSFDVYEADHDDESVPAWADITVLIDDPDGAEIIVHMAREQLQELYEAIDFELRLRHGPKIMDMLWDSLDDLTGRLMRNKFRDSGEKAATKHRAEGMAWALALMTNPVEPSLDAIRETAVERWETTPD